jgi:hypothetical protein
MEPELVSNKICIVGGSQGRDDAIAYKNTDWNIWCPARVYDAVSYASLVFEAHQDSTRWTSRTTQAFKDKKLILQMPEKQFPSAFLLPVPEMLDKFGGVFTSSFSWMLAYALYRGATDISFCGVNMAHETELLTQRPGLFFLLGYARANDINIFISEHSQLRREIDFRTN